MPFCCQGFEAQGTTISNRLNAYDLLLEETVTNPSQLHLNAVDLAVDLNWRQKFVSQNTTRAHDSDDETDDTTDKALQEHEMSLQVDNYFCDIPS